MPWQDVKNHGTGVNHILFPSFRSHFPPAIRESQTSYSNLGLLGCMISWYDNQHFQARVNLVVADLSLVNFDFVHSVSRLLLLRQMEFWQNRLGTWARWREHLNQSQPNPGSSATRLIPELGQGKPGLLWTFSSPCERHQREEFGASLLHASVKRVFPMFREWLA